MKTSLIGHDPALVVTQPKSFSMTSNPGRTARPRLPTGIRQHLSSPRKSEWRKVQYELQSPSQPGGLHLTGELASRCLHLPTQATNHPIFPPLSSSICAEENTGCIRSQASGVNFQHYKERVGMKWNPTGKPPRTILKIYPIVLPLKLEATTAQSWLLTPEQLSKWKSSDILSEKSPQFIKPIILFQLNHR